jgi:hypothetical protein
MRRSRCSCGHIFAPTGRDITADGLIMRQTKFQKSRLLPLHETVRRALDRYCDRSHTFAVRSPPPIREHS